MTPERARNLADALLGMEDAKRDLLAAYVADADDSALVEAAERWERSADALAALLD